MNNPNWPIRVGGEYRSVFGLTKRVTAIVGDKVHFLYPDGGCSDGVCSVETFRDLHHPQDQSPLPELVEALEFLVRVDHDSADYDDAIALARRALAKAKTTAVPESPEVAA